MVLCLLLDTILERRRHRDRSKPSKLLRERSNSGAAETLTRVWIYNLYLPLRDVDDASVMRSMMERPTAY
jgi:hypothetical protein